MKEELMKLSISELIKILKESIQEHRHSVPHLGILKNDNERNIQPHQNLNQ